MTLSDFLTKEKNSWKRSLILGLGLLSTVFFFSKEISFQEVERSFFIDFLEYYAGAQLLVQGGNPYSGQELHTLQLTIKTIDSPIRLWNPPLVFSFIFWLGFLPYKTALFLWITSLCLSLVLGMTWLWKANIFSQPAILLIILFAVSWQVLSECFFFGQISFIFLLSSSAFFSYLRRDENPAANFCAGLLLVPLLIKPHGFAFFLFLLGLQSLKTKCFQTLAGLFCGSLICSLFPLFFQPDIYFQYWQALQEPPLYFKTPTLGSFLQEWSGEASIFWRLLPLSLALIGALLFSFIRKSFHWGSEALLAMLPLSLLVSPYSWLYDSLVLLPFVFWILGTERKKPFGRILIGLFFVLHVLLLVLPKGGQQETIWYILSLSMLGFLKLCDSLSSQKSLSKESYLSVNKT